VAEINDCPPCGGQNVKFRSVSVFLQLLAASGQFPDSSNSCQQSATGGQQSGETTVVVLLIAGSKLLASDAGV
jgi:hypothetical protein